MNWQRWTIAIIFLFGLGVIAQETPKKPAPTATAGAAGGQRTQSINFEDELVEGEVKKPELLYLLQKKQFNFKRLIKLRENFLPEMNRTAEDVGRGKGQGQ